MIRPTTSLVRQSVALASRRAASTHALSKPTLANIEKRWEGMPPQEQADLWMALRDRMKSNWTELTPQEKKAAYWIAFGDHGPRSPPPAGEGKRIFAGVMTALAATAVIFGAIRLAAKPSTLPSMNKEWQEASNEILIARNSDPLTGISSEYYKGPGMVQSPPKSG